MRHLFLRENLPGTLAVAGILLAALSVVTPWFVVDNFDGGRHNPLEEFYLGQMVDHRTDGTRLLTTYDLTACRCDRVESVFTLTQVLIWSGALLAAAAYWGRSWTRLRDEQAVALTAIAGLLMVAAPVLLALNLPGAFAADADTVANTPAQGRWASSFVGSSVISSVRVMYWGPGLAWIFALLAGGLTLASVSRERRKALASAATAPQAARGAHAPVAAPPAAPQSNGGAL